MLCAAQTPSTKTPPTLDLSQEKSIIGSKSLGKLNLFMKANEARLNELELIVIGEHGGENLIHLKDGELVPVLPTILDPPIYN
jgi:hypothetical protein